MFSSISNIQHSKGVTIRTLDMELAHFTQPPSVQALVTHLHRQYPGGQFYSAYEAGFCGTTAHEQLSEGNITLKQMAWLDNPELSTEAGTLCLKQYLQEYQHQRKGLNELTRVLRNQIQKHYKQAYEILLSMPGYGPIVCAALLAEIGDFTRFEDPDDYCSYLGLLPWSDSSGENIRTKGIQPRCNKHLRYLLIEAAWSGIRKDRFIK